MTFEVGLADGREIGVFRKRRRLRLQLMNTVSRRNEHCSGLDLKTLNLALKPFDAIFQPAHVLFARIVHAEGLGPVIQALPKVLEHRYGSCV
jgi:hypothetical protein